VVAADGGRGSPLLEVRGQLGQQHAVQVVAVAEVLAELVRERRGLVLVRAHPVSQSQPSRVDVAA
jgi:hypothetical protein